MDSYFVSAIDHGDGRRIAQWERLLAGEGITRDPHLDYTVGMYNTDYNLIAAGSCFSNTLRCLAVDGDHRGEGHLAVIVTHLLGHLASRGITHVFLYTKRENAQFFIGLGFSEIDAGVESTAFMENRRNGFSSYLAELAGHRRDGTCAAIVMNCNPFTLGHRCLAEEAARRNDCVHIFVVSEDVSLFPYPDRLSMVSKGVSDLGNALIHPTGSYIISNAVFPSYFMEDSESAIRAQASLDAGLFARIAASLGITGRYAGTEPFSMVTGIYNDVMRAALPAVGIDFIEIKRAGLNGRPISASRVRDMIKAGDMDAVREMVPKSTYEYLLSEKGCETVKRITEADSVIHY